MLDGKRHYTLPVTRGRPLVVQVASFIVIRFLLAEASTVDALNDSFLDNKNRPQIDDSPIRGDALILTRAPHFQVPGRV